MTSFVHIHYPEQHPGVARAEAVIAAAGRLRRSFDGTRGIAALLLAAFVAALVVLADRLVDRWTGGRLLAAWVVLWAVAFAALALFAGAARRLAAALVQRLDAWSAHKARARADARLWATAQTDPRVMADLRAAVLRDEAARLPSAAVAALRAAEAPARRSLRQVVLDWQRDVQRARADVAFLQAAEADPRLMADLRGAQARVEADAQVPAETQTLLRADEAARLQRDLAHARGSRYAYYTM